MKLPESWTEDCGELLRAFNKEGVEYLLFGSMAKSHYRHSPASVGDVDVLLNPTLENAKKVKPALDFVVRRIWPRTRVRVMGRHLAVRISRGPRIARPQLA